MIVTCIYLKVKPDKIKAFIEATVENHRASVKEPGNLRFDLIQREDDPEQFMLYEAYESEAAAAEHKTTSHYQKWADLAEGFMAEPRQRVRYNILEPKDRSQW
jgi:autoinducer 2-degrading protein